LGEIWSSWKYCWWSYRNENGKLNYYSVIYYKVISVFPIYPNLPVLSFIIIYTSR
jgi:hypothetical protein